MPDDMDRVQAVNEQWIEGCLAEHRRKTKTCEVLESPQICIDCESAIPAARLKAQPNATRCTDCQNNFEIATRRNH